MPTMYEENLLEDRKNIPRIIGLVTNSPAAISGLKRGDVITRVNGIPVSNRVQARHLLSIVHGSSKAEITISVLRKGKTEELLINQSDFAYPYSPKIDRHMGIIFLGTGLSIGYLERLREIIESHGAKRILFMSSTLVKPTFEQCLAESPLFGDELDVAIEVPRNNLLGGNIFMGDLLMVQDFIDCAKDHLTKASRKPDLIVIPSSPFGLGGWGRDLTGRVYLDIEREVGVPVELLECIPLYD